MKKLSEISHDGLSHSFYDKEEITLVYQPGRMASHSIFFSLNRYYFGGRKLFHVHGLNIGNIEKAWKFHKKANITKQGSYGLSSALAPVINDYKDNFRINIISVIRDPISFALSSIFYQYIIHKTERNWKNISFIDFLNDIKIIIDNKVKYFMDWYKTELGKVFRIEVENLNFDSNKGYIIQEYDKKSLLFFQFEKINEVYSNAIEEFLGYKTELQRINAVEDLKIKKIFNDVKNSISFDSKIIDEIYSDKLIKTFYSSFEIEKMKYKWLK